MAVQRNVDGAEPIRPQSAGQELRRVARSGRLGTGTLACPACDAPVALVDGPVSPAAPLACPYCGEAGAVRDFLSLQAPSRPARVEVRVIAHRGRL